MLYLSFSDVDQYADASYYDFLSFTAMEQHLQIDVNSIMRWLVPNKPWINVSETKTMLIGSQQRVGRQLLLTISNFVMYLLPSICI